MITKYGGISIVSVDKLMFDGNEEERQSHDGIFKGCFGAFNVDYLGHTFSERDIETLLIDEYAYRDISFFTWQEFAHKIKTTWNRNILQLIENLKKAPELKLNSAYESVTENSSGNAQTSSNSTGNESASDSGVNVKKVSNTPNEYLQNPESFNGLTGYENNDNQNTRTGERSASATGTANTTGTREIERETGRNALEMWLHLSEINRNIIYDFIDKFEPLFKQTARLYNNF